MSHNACGLEVNTEDWRLKPHEGEPLWKICEEKMNAVGQQSNNIAVLTRVRPFNKREKELNTYKCLEMKMLEGNYQTWYASSKHAMCCSEA